MGSSSCPVKWVLNEKLCEAAQAQRKSDVEVPAGLRLCEMWLWPHCGGTP